MSVSAANIKYLDRYLSDLLDSGRTMRDVVTRFRALSDKNASGTEFTGLKITVAHKLDVSAQLQLESEVIEKFRGTFRSTTVELPERSSQAAKAMPETEETRQRAREVMS